MEELKVTDNELKEILRQHKLSTAGTKTELVKRLLDAGVSMEELTSSIIEEAEEHQEETLLDPQEEEEAIAEISIADENDELLRLRKEVTRLREIERLREELARLSSRSEEHQGTLTKTSSRGESSSSIMTNGHQLNIKSIGEMIDEFDGSARNMLVWEKQVLKIIEVHGLEDKMAKLVIVSRLKGKARKWYYSRSDLLKLDVKELLAELTKMFDVRPSKLDLKKKFEARTWKASESFPDYFHDKIIKANEIVIPEEELVDYIIDGIPDHHIRTQARIQNFQSTQGVLQAFRKVTLTSGSENTKRYSGDERKTGKDTKKRERTQKAKAFCYKCKKPGHIAKMCTKSNNELLCFTCCEKGHYARACTKKTDNSGSSTKTADVSESVVRHINGNSHRKYFKDVKIDGQSIRGYVDLESSVNAIRKDAASVIGINAYYEAGLKPFTRYGNGRVQPLGVVTADIEVDNVKVRTEVYVVPNECQEIPLLIGHPFTERQGIVILSTPEELRVARSVEGLDLTTDKQSERTAIWADKAQVIPNNYLGHIAVATNLPNQDLCIEGGLRDAGPTMPRCIVTTDDKGRTMVPVLNLMGKEMT